MMRQAAATEPPMSDSPLVSMRDITKAFDGVLAVDGVSFDLVAGEVHVVAGENGAGKSTLMCVLSGVLAADGGRIELDGRPVRFRSPHEAAAHGIAMIHQEMSLVPTLSVADNLFLGREPGAGPWRRPRRQRREAQRLMRLLDVTLDVDRPAGDFPIAVRQLIEIAKALAGQSRILIMDEPTSALNEAETKRLFSLIQSLQRRGCGIVFITHKLEEIYRVGTRITVLRDGRAVTTAPADALGPAALVRCLVGRPLDRQFPSRPPPSAGRTDPVLELDGVSMRHPDQPGRWLFRAVTGAVHPGEIVGLAGLQGSGASELLQGLYGRYGPLTAGRVRVNGHPGRIRSPRDALAMGIALLTNDRKGAGLLPGASVTHNLTVASLRTTTPGGWLRPARERAEAVRCGAALNIRMRSPEQDVADLSGGNQQKVLIGRWLLTRPAVFLLDEPTRGMDVGAKHDLYELMNAWTADGMAILMVTTEMPELLAMADRVLVMHRGTPVADWPRAEATQDRIMEAALGAACA